MFSDSNIDNCPAKDKRRFIRHPMCFPLSFKVIKKGAAGFFARGNREEYTSTINVGRGGLLFPATRPVAESTVISIKIPFENKMFKVKAMVVHCVKDRSSGLYNIGVCFHRVEDAFKVKLIEQMYLISEYRDLRSIQLGRNISLEEASEDWIKRYSERFQRLYW